MDATAAARLRQQIEDYVNGEATPDACGELEQTLLASGEARRAYLDYINVHSALSRRFLSAAAAKAELQVELAEFRREAISQAYAPKGRRWRVRSMIVQLSVLIAVGGWLGYVGWRSADDPKLAEIRQVAGEVTLVRGKFTSHAVAGESLARGSQLRTSDDGGGALLRFRDGTTVLLHEASSVVVPPSGDVRLRLVDGSMEVHAAKQAPGRSLVFATEHSRVVVVGTRFRLYHEAAATRLELDEGKVHLEHAAGGRSVAVDAGNVATISEANEDIEIQPLALGTAQLARSWKHAGQAVAFSRDGERLVASDWGRGFSLLDTASDVPLKTRGPEIGRAAGLAFSNDESHALHLNRDGQLAMWRLDKNRTRTLALNGEHPRSHALSFDGRFAVESAQRSIRLFEVDVDKKSLMPKAEIIGDGKAWCLAITPDGNRLAAGFWNGRVSVYDTATGEAVFHHQLAHTPTVIALTDDAEQLAVFSQKDGLRLMSTVAAVPRQLWPAGHDLVRCVRFTADSKRLLAGMKDRTARIWSVDDAQPLLVVDTGQVVQGLAWFEQQQLLATADGTVKLWKCDLTPALAAAPSKPNSIDGNRE